MIRKLGVMLLVGVICVLGVTSAWAAKYNEAPMLKVEVAAGELPPVEERLPEEPMVVEPIEEIGEYGGTIFLLYRNPIDSEDGHMIIGYEPLFRIGRDLKNIIPNIAKSWKFSEEGKALTIHLRKGIKWSDGIPFTADDILFWYEDVLLNDELTPVKPGYWRPGGELMRMEKIDDYTIRLRFSVPSPLIETRLARNYGSAGSFLLPKHYMKQFHPRYVPKDELDRKTKEAGYDFWYELFQAKNHFTAADPRQTPDAPSLATHVLTASAMGTIIYERNPYYWKVDTAGNQLPYIDEVQLTLVENIEAANMKIVSGEVDFAGIHLSLSVYSLLKENETTGDYQVQLRKPYISSDTSYMFNNVHPDPVKRKIFSDPRFRFAMSLAINRDEINESLFFGMGQPSQPTAFSWTSYYEEAFAKAYVEYNPQEANQLLDEIGLEKRDQAGFRLMPDGRRLSVVNEYYPVFPSTTPTGELVKEYWGAVGVELILKPEDRSYWFTRLQTAEYDLTSWPTDRCSEFVFTTDPIWFVPLHPYTGWGVPWYNWYNTGGKEGEEPPAEVKKLFELYEKMQSTMVKEERIEAGKGILRSQAENLWLIGTVGYTPYPVVVKNRLRNTQEEGGVWGTGYQYTMPECPEQFFLEK